MPIPQGQQQYGYYPTHGQFSQNQQQMMGQQYGYYPTHGQFSQSQQQMPMTRQKYGYYSAPSYFPVNPQMPMMEQSCVYYPTPGDYAFNQQMQAPPSMTIPQSSDSTRVFNIDAQEKKQGKGRFGE